MVIISKMRVVTATVAVAAALLLAAFMPRGVPGGAPTPPPNATSVIGTNFLEPLNNGSTPENFALNAFKLNGGPFTNGGANDGTTAYTHCTDSDHYLNVSPAACAAGFGTTFTKFSYFIFASQGGPYNYPAGNYPFDWDGPADASFAFSGRDTAIATACPLASHPNRMILAYNSPNSGIQIDLSGIGTGGYPKNIRLTNGNVVMPGDVQSTCSTIGTREALMYAGERFDPQFIAETNFYSVLRYMKWGMLQSNTLQHWADRPLESWSSWNEVNFAMPSGAKNVGVPYEVFIALCNEVKASCWFNAPEGADINFHVPLATLALNNLDPARKVLVEYGNEPFLTGNFPQPLINNLGVAAYPCSASSVPTVCPAGTGSVAGTVLTITSGSVGQWEIGVIVSDGAAHTATIIAPKVSGNGGNGDYNLSNSTLTGTSFTGTHPGSQFQNSLGWARLGTAMSAIGWKSVWTGANAARLTTIGISQWGNFGFATAFLNSLATDYGGVACAGCSGNVWSGTVASHIDAGSTAPYFPSGDNWSGCPHAWSADGDLGVGRCSDQYISGGHLVLASSTVTTTHTTDSLNACSVALSIPANHYVATIGGLGSVANGTAIAITFDVATAGPCDDLNVNGGGAFQIQQDHETFIQNTGGSPVTISGATLTITGTGGNTVNFTACCGPKVLPGGQVVLSGAAANTFIVSQATIVNGPANYSGTYTVSVNQNLTCNPCAVTNPVPTGTTGVHMFIFTNATSAGAMPTSWRGIGNSLTLCSSADCFERTGGLIHQVLSVTTGDINSFNSTYGLPYVSYEGGMSVQSCCRGDEQETMIVAMYRDPIMGTIQSTFLNGLRGTGYNGPLVLFTNIYPIASAGLNYGALESSRENTSPKFNANKTYATTVPCWWVGCGP